MKIKQPTLRKYQTTDVAAIEQAWKEFRSVLYQLPTGGGKSVVLSKIIGDYREEKILVLAHKRRLLTQMQGHLNNVGIKAGLLIAQREENLDSNIVIASIRTAVKSKRLDMLVSRHWDKVIIDEARHSRTGSYDIVLDRLLQVHPTHKLLGVDATPHRKDKKRLDKHFQKMVVSSETIKSLQEKGFLAQIRTFATPIGQIQEEVKEVANDYQQAALSEYMRKPKFLDYVVDAYIKWGERRQAIVFAVDKAHSKDLLAVFKKKGFTKVAQIDSDLSQDEIDKVYSAYENKEIDVLINVEMLTEGVDLPETGCIVGARPTKSLTLYLQMGGRGTRPKEDGSDLILIDCAGWTEEFGTLNAPKEWSLDPEVDPNDPRKKNRIVGKDKNGNFTTNVDEMDEFTELIEMTPEEYIGKVKGGLKAAEQQNQTIDQKIKKVENDLAELLHKAAVDGLKGKVSPFVCAVGQDRYDKDRLVATWLHKSRARSVKDGDEDGDSDENSGITWDRGTHIVQMILSKRENMYATISAKHIEDYYGRQNKESLKEYREMAQVCGQVNGMIMDNKNLLLQILDKQQQIHDLKKSKINLEEYRDLQKKFEKDQWKKSVEDHLKTGQVFKLNNLSADNQFKGYWRVNIVGIQIPNQSINTHHNTILLTLVNKHSDKEFIEEKKYVKGEKVYELLEQGHWTSKQLVNEKAKV